MITRLIRVIMAAGFARPYSAAMRTALALSPKLID